MLRIGVGYFVGGVVVEAGLLVDDAGFTEEAPGLEEAPGTPGFAPPDLGGGGAIPDCAL